MPNPNKPRPGQPAEGEQRGVTAWALHIPLWGNPSARLPLLTFLAHKTILLVLRRLRSPPEPAASNPATPTAHSPPPHVPQDGLPSTTSLTNHECKPPPHTHTQPTHPAGGRQRWQRGRQRHQRYVPAARRALLRGGRAQVHRQRHPAHRQVLWLRHGGGGEPARAHGGKGAGAGWGAPGLVGSSLLLCLCPPPSQPTSHTSIIAILFRTCHAMDPRVCGLPRLFWKGLLPWLTN